MVAKVGIQIISLYSMPGWTCCLRYDVMYEVRLPKQYRVPKVRCSENPPMRARTPSILSGANILEKAVQIAIFWSCCFLGKRKCLLKAAKVLSERNVVLSRNVFKYWHTCWQVITWLLLLLYCLLQCHDLQLSSGYDFRFLEVGDGRRHDSCLCLILKKSGKNNQQNFFYKKFCRSWCRTFY